MKKLIALLLVLTLTLGVGATALAKDGAFKTQLLDSLNQPISSYYSTADTRAMFGVLILLDYISSSGDSTDNFYYAKTMYLQKYSDTTLYFYIAGAKGGYYEMRYYKGTGSYSSATCTFYSTYTESSVKNSLSGQQGSFYSITPMDFLGALTTLQGLLDN